MCRAKLSCGSADVSTGQQTTQQSLQVDQSVCLLLLLHLSDGTDLSMSCKSATTHELQCFDLKHEAAIVEHSKLSDLTDTYQGT